MSDTEKQQAGRVVGLGGVFLKTPDIDRSRSWYSENLGLSGGPEGFQFRWRTSDDEAAEHCTVWALFPAKSNYFDPSEAPFMLNYIVDDLDAILEKLAANGVRIDPKREDVSYGRFAWIYDPDGNKIELWQPLNPAAA